MKKISGAHLCKKYVSRNTTGIVPHFFRLFGFFILQSSLFTELTRKVHLHIYFFRIISQDFKNVPYNFCNFLISVSPVTSKSVGKIYKIIRQPPAVHNEILTMDFECIKILRPVQCVWHLIILYNVERKWPYTLWGGVPSPQASPPRSGRGRWSRTFAWTRIRIVREDCETQD